MSGGSDKADAAAWLAVAAGTIGALMATLDTSIVNAALPTIQGEIGASGSDGTWVSTAYLVAEIVMIPMAAWFQSILGLRNFLLVMVSLFTAASMWCGVSSSLVEMIFGRVVQGFTGGALIPTALTIVATRLPPKQQSIGVALFGMTAVLGPVLGPVIGGWLTENVSWHYAFFLNLPICLGLLVLLFVGLHPEKANLDALRNADLLGILGLLLGLGGLTVVLEEGERDLWFQSELIRELSAVSAIGFVLLIAGQFVARKPIIQLKILLDRTFFVVFLLSLGAGGALYGIIYLIPQYLTAVPGYNAEQSGDIAALSGIPTLMLLVIFPLMVKVVDMRLAVALGLGLYSVSCFMNAFLSPDSAGAQFVSAQLLRGVAQFFSILFLNQAATASVSHDLSEDASGLFNAARNLGGSFALAMVATLQDQRQTLHSTRLSEAMPANSVQVQDAVSNQGIDQIVNIIQQQATVMTYADLFWVFGVALAIMTPLALLLKPLPKDADVSMG